MERTTAQTVMDTLRPQRPMTYTVAQVAQELQMSRKTVIREIKLRELPALKVRKMWRIRREALDSYLRQREMSERNQQRS